MGVRLYYEVFGTGGPTVLLLPSWAIVPSRVWKLQVPYLARHYRVITFDPRGNGRSDRPLRPEDHADTELVADAIAVLDATDTAQAVCVGMSMGCGVLLRLAVAHPDRVAGAVFVTPGVGLADVPGRAAWFARFDEELESPAGWAKNNAAYWRRDLGGFADFFFGEMFPEPHSTKQIDDCCAWALDSGAETLIATWKAPYLQVPNAGSAHPAVYLAEHVTCPSLVVDAGDDRIVGVGGGAALAAAIGCRVEVFEGSGHGLPARHPVRFNIVVREFVESVAAGRR